MVGPGFIIYSDNENTFIFVHHCNVKHGEMLNVIFSNNTTHKASVLFNRDPHTVVVVENLTTSTCSHVTFIEDTIKRDTFFTVARVQIQGGLGLMTGRIM